MSQHVTEDSLSKLTHERYRGFANLQVGPRGGRSAMTLRCVSDG